MLVSILQDMYEIFATTFTCIIVANADDAWLIKQQTSMRSNTCTCMHGVVQRMLDSHIGLPLDKCSTDIQINDDNWYKARAACQGAYRRHMCSHLLLLMVDTHT